ncbi:P-loop containing nucleoside triphosphate hydrolase protein, partial [Tuber indicum]
KHEAAYEIQRRMEADGHKASTLRSAEEVPDRDKAVNAFRSRKAKVLITTDVLARGIDVATVSMVVNYDLSPGKNRRLDAVTYLRRIGNTGRFGRVGVAITLAHGMQSLKITVKLSEVGEISNHFGACITRVPTNDIEVCSFLIPRVLFGILIHCWYEVEIIVNSVLKNKGVGGTGL